MWNQACLYAAVCPYIHTYMKPSYQLGAEDEKSPLRNQKKQQPGRRNKDENAFGGGFCQRRDVKHNGGCQRVLEGWLYGM